MKRRLNFITLLIAFAFGLYTSFAIYRTFMESVTVGMSVDSENNTQQSGSSKQKNNNLLLFLDLVPENQDSVYNARTSTWLPAKIEKMTVEIKERKMPLLVVLPVGIIGLACMILIMVCFFKLVISVNKSVIFDRKNVRRLRYIGTGFLLLFLMNIGAGYYFLEMAKDLVQVPGYKISPGEVLEAKDLVMGLVAFFFAEIFAIGIRLREEQELTI